MLIQILAICLLTSGAVEVAPDESAFADQLISVLKHNDRPVLDTLMLFNEASLLLFLRDEAAPGDRQSKDAAAQVLPYPQDGSPAETAESGSSRPRRFPLDSPRAFGSE